MSDEIVNWDELYKKSKDFSKEDMQFIFDEAKQFLDTNIKIGESFKTRSTTALSFLVPAILAIFGYLMSMEHVSFINFFPIWTGAIFLVVASFLCLNIINTKSSYFMGCKPSNLLGYSWGNKDPTIEGMIFSQCEAYQARIEHRIEENDKIGNEFKIAVWLMFSAPLATYITFLLILFFG